MAYIGLTRNKVNDKEQIILIDKTNPTHYKKHPSGIEAIEITRHFNFNIGNVIKYCWRAGLKSDDAIEDLKKAAWYINDEIKRLEKSRELE